MSLYLRLFEIRVIYRTEVYRVTNLPHTPSTRLLPGTAGSRGCASSSPHNLIERLLRLSLLIFNYYKLSITIPYLLLVLL